MTDDTTPDDRPNRPAPKRAPSTPSGIAHDLNGFEAKAEVMARVAADAEARAVAAEKRATEAKADLAQTRLRWVERDTRLTEAEAEVARLQGIVEQVREWKRARQTGAGGSYAALTAILAAPEKEGEQ